MNLEKRDSKLIYIAEKSQNNFENATHQNASSNIPTHGPDFGGNRNAVRSIQGNNRSEAIMYDSSRGRSTIQNNEGNTSRLSRVRPAIQDRESNSSTNRSIRSRPTIQNLDDGRTNQVCYLKNLNLFTERFSISKVSRNIERLQIARNDDDELRNSIIKERILKHLNNIDKKKLNTLINNDAKSYGLYTKITREEREKIENVNIEEER